MARLLISLMVLTVFIAFSSALQDRRVQRHSDAIFTSEYSKLLQREAARKYLESVLNPKRSTVERHSDAIFTSEYSKLLQREAARKYLESLLNPKRSLSDQETAQENK
ncbi:hypothetical protein GDO81_029066 [Engystomops pustulosus]|uniref:Glucagon / GIP / secretin / VIP family domain-containing protein n=1 Tax=Engystomops pustulosus TaxID=76066 RepID=A0AAV6ZCM3_ENGPU|nr:hypothetical protein GDO81_029066 [Engystomops pustulosus]